MLTIHPFSSSLATRNAAIASGPARSLASRGFVHVQCPVCHEDKVVAFSCKLRGLSPSCAGRRMAGTAAHLVNCVLPAVPVRQYVLAFPSCRAWRPRDPRYCARCRHFLGGGAPALPALGQARGWRVAGYDKSEPDSKTCDVNLRSCEYSANLLTHRVNVVEYRSGKAVKRESRIAKFCSAELGAFKF